MRIAAKVGAVALGVLVSTGCTAVVATPPPPAAPASAGATAAPATTGARPADDGPEQIAGAGTEPGSVDGTVPGALTAVRMARHATFDRLVFEFRDGDPGYLVEYVDDVRAEGSGDPVAVGGDVALLVVMRPAGGYDPDLGTPTYTGPARLPGAGTDQIVEVVRTGDFEGHLVWAVGVRGEQPFAVRKLADPPRVVVDISH